MAADNCRKSGHIPAFGDWENANEMPITQYFECARQAGLHRCSCGGECGASASGELYGPGFRKSMPRRVHAAPQRKTSGKKMEYRYPKEQKKKVHKVRDLMDDQPRNREASYLTKYGSRSKSSASLISQPRPSVTVKPVDEDLYKIPTELLENSKRKRMLGFFSRCIMVPPCSA